MAFLNRPPTPHGRWIQPGFASFDPREDTYSRYARHRVGATPAELAAEGTATADAYSYGAASAALSEGQAAQAWNELKKQQNFPAVKQIASTHSCPPGWLISPEGTTCVNQDNVHIAQGSIPGEWYWNSALSSYVRLNEEKAWSSGSLSELADAALRGLRAMRMTSGNYGWTNVKSELRGLVSMAVHGGGSFRDKNGDDIDALSFELEKSIGPLYDKDQANKPATEAKSSAIISNLIQSAHSGAQQRKLAGASYLVPLALGAAALAVFAPGVALGAVAMIWTGAKRAGSYVAGKAKGAVT